MGGSWQCCGVFPRGSTPTGEDYSAGGTVQGEARSDGHSLLPQAVEAAQLAEDLKVQQEHVQCKLKEIQACMAENRAAKEKESFNLKRAQVGGGGLWGILGGEAGEGPGPLADWIFPALQEDISRLRRKLEKQKKVEVYADADEILQEEIKEYKVGRGQLREEGEAWHRGRGVRGGTKLGEGLCSGSGFGGKEARPPH